MRCYAGVHGLRDVALESVVPFPFEKLRAFDTETWLIRPGLAAPPIVCASIAGPTPGDERIVDKAAALRTFRGCVAGDGIIGGANLVYDFGVMAANFPETIPDIFRSLEESRAVSTDILEALHDNARGFMYRDPLTGQPFARDESGEAVGRYSLALLEKRYLGIDRTAEKENGWRLRYAELDGTPLTMWPDEAIEYPRRDARGTFDVLRAQLAEGRQNVQCIGQEMRAAWALHLMKIYGMRVDPEMGASVVKRIEEQREKDQVRFIAAGILREDGSCDTKVLKGLVALAYKGAPPKTEPSTRFPEGQISTSRDTLLESGDELLEAYGEAGPNEKLHSTFSKLLTATEPIHPEFTVLVQSGRTSCSRPNLQQLPRKGSIRECFVPRLGSVYVSVDYAANELVTLSQVCLEWFKASRMADAINAGQDLHCRLVGRVIGRSYDEVYP